MGTGTERETDKITHLLANKVYITIIAETSTVI